MNRIEHIGTVAEQLLNVAYLSARPVPTAPDGRYEPGEDDPTHLKKVIDRVHTQMERGNPISFLGDQRAFDAFVDAMNSKNKGTDDRMHAFEMGVDFLTKCDPKSEMVQKLNDVAIDGFFSKLQHPPAAYVGISQFRSDDGSNNNPMMPDLGKAGTNYARSVQGKTPIPDHELPDPALLFDVLLKRRDDPNEDNTHPNGNSALTFAFASLVTHMLFRTSRNDPNINNTSSYLDLSPLYGVNHEEQMTVRDITGRGKLYPDTFAEDRLDHLPPATGALLVIFNRNHNYIADMLLQINEKGKWSDPSKFHPDDPTLRSQDFEIFNTARLINCAAFMGMIFGDYVAGFLGNTRNGQSWHMKPFSKIIRSSGEKVSRGEGNHVSVEFNLLYRWHAVISQEDEEWTNRGFKRIFGTNEWEKITVQQVLDMANSPRFTATAPPKERDLFHIPSMKRQADGKYADADLAKILMDATETPAHKYGARCTPAALRVVEMMSIMEGRKWGVCTMNEFRTCMGLRKFATFEEWNSDPAIAGAARQLYHHIDRLELYVGLQAEETMEMTSYASGFCCGYTTMHAILVDAICLVRGDRFFTSDFTPQNLTAWGWNDVQRTKGNDNGCWGACLPKLLLRHLPDDYAYNSVHALFPFFTPKRMRGFMAKMEDGEELVKSYLFERAPRQMDPVALTTMKGIRTVWDDPEKYKVVYTDNMKFLTQDYGFFLVFDERQRHDVDKKLCMHALWPDMHAYDDYADFYKTTTSRLINANSFRYDVGENSSSPFHGKYVDIVRNVINITSVRWASEYLTGMPLKTKETPHGIFTEAEAYDMLMVLFMCVFENFAPEHGWFLRTKAKQVGDALNAIIERSLRQAMPGVRGWTSWATASLSGTSISGKPCEPFLRRLAASGRSLKDLTACVMGLTVGSSVNYAQAAAQVVDFYLDDARKHAKDHIVELVQRDENDAEATDLLVGYLKEAQRLAPQFPGLLRVSASDKVEVVEQGNDKEPVTIHPGQPIFGSYYDAQTDPTDFPDPLTVNPRRPRDSYAVQGIGFHGCPGVKYAERTLVAMMRVVFKLPGIKRAPFAAGTMASFKSEQEGTSMRLYLDSNGNMSPWPGSLIVTYDG